MRSATIGFDDLLSDVGASGTCRALMMPAGERQTTLGTFIYQSGERGKYLCSRHQSSEMGCKRRR